jgi:hypothetical protein
MIWRSGQRLLRRDRQAAQWPHVTSGLMVHAPSCLRAGHDDPGRLMAEDKRRRPSLIVPEIGVHVGSADSDRVDPDERFTVTRDCIGFVAIIHPFGAGVDERLHFAVNPPSTKSTWPVT